MSKTPYVSLDKMPPDNDKLPSGAYYLDGMNTYGMLLGDGTIHLDRRFGKWHSLQLTAVHEFGHWLDFHSRRKSANDHDAFVKAGKADVENLFTIEDTAGKRKMTDAEKAKRFGTDDRTRRGSYWREDIATKLFCGRPDNISKQYVIMSYADTMQSITMGRYGWGHDNKYAERKVVHVNSSKNGNASV